ncbi:site-specific DNA-methyltransferase [Emticicia sp.]|uniref:site-specific DNA-methyltransferase n=1 Tax=Emticicia sp. TaxID=1930953 RepID=UPI00375001B5
MTADHLDLTSTDLVSQNIDKIAALFPNCITETANGKALDFDLLRQELSDQIIEGNKERYRLEWPGKREAIVTANLPTTNTLRPIEADSVAFDTTENLYIEGDNLEVLKLLQESYLGVIKMIYIDPPYNTGNDFVYKDNYAQSTEDFKVDSGLIDEYRQRLVANPDTAGRYHSDWLSMMYPRLKLARNLLTDDGVIFISIDDHEVHNLRKLCDEIFGENNFVANIIWEKKFAPSNDAKWFSDNHDHILVFAKNKDLFRPNLLERNLETLNRYKNPDNDFRGAWVSGDMTVKTYNANYDFEIITPSGRKVSPPKGICWRFSKEKVFELIAENRVWFGENGDNVPRLKRFLSEVKDGVTPLTIWYHKDVAHNQEAAQELRKIFEGEQYFETPKPIRLLKRIIQLGVNNNDLILDFFSGSSSTAHAVMQLNTEDGGNRNFIMVQVPEPTDEKSEAFKAGYTNICEIGKERIRRAAKKIAEEQTSKRTKQATEIEFEQKDEQHLDLGFRVYRLDSSNMHEVYYKPQQYSQASLDMFADNIKADRSPQDLLAQIMLNLGLPLSLKIEESLVLEKRVYRVLGNQLVVCFDKGIDEAFARAIAQDFPQKLVFRDASFVSDAAKVNVKQLLKQLSPETQMRVI